MDITITPPTIEVTTNFGLFKTLKGNREVKKAHVKKLKAFIQKDPQALRYTPLLVNSKLADDTKVYFAGEKLDLFVLEKLSDPNIRNEQKTVAVLNGTDYPGLAQKISRIISNMGGNVVISDNADFKIKYTQVLGARSETLERFKQIFTSKYAKMEMQSAAWVDRFASRAQIILVLGEDMASR